MMCDTVIGWDERIGREAVKRNRLRRRRSYGTQARQNTVREQLFKVQAGRCHYCGCGMTTNDRVPGQPVPRTSCTLEHLVTHLDGGKTSLENCRAACFDCNNLKGQIDLTTRTLERELNGGGWIDIHYYAARLATLLERWARTPSRDTRRMAETPKSGSGRSPSGANSSKNNHQAD